MEINEKWRLVEELDAIVVDSLNLVWFLPVGVKKVKKNAILKTIPNNTPYREVHLEDNSFKLRLDAGDDIDLKLYLTNKNLSDKELIVSNPNKTNITKLILQSNISNGNINESNIEAIFSEHFPEDVGFTHENMKEYDDYFDEMVRRVNCKFRKKTKKWVPGHRYDSETDTLYYLGEFYSHKNDQYCSYYNKTELTKVYLVTNNIKGLSSISDVFKNKSFNSKGIIVLDKLPSMVDSGEKLKNDMNNIKDLYSYLLNNSKNLTEKLEVLNYESSPENNNIYQGPEINDIKNDIKQLMFKCLLNYWDTSSYYIDPSCILSKKNSIELNSESLLKLIFQYFINDSNSLASVYYKSLFNEFNIDLFDIAKEEITNFSESLVISSFENYLKYSNDYFKYRDAETLTSYQRTNKSIPEGTYYSRKRNTIKDLLGGDTLLTEKIKELVNNTILNYGIGIKLFNLRNAGTKSNPKEYYEIKITLDDLIKYEPNLDQELKDEIIKNRFREIYIELDKDGILQ